MPPKRSPGLAATKERKRREAEERERSRKMDLLRREVRLGASTAKLNRRIWRDAVMRVKMPIIAQDSEVARRTFDRAIDIKNYSASLLMDSLDDAEEQYRMNARTHIENVDKIMGIYRERLLKEESNYRTELRRMLNEAQAESETIGIERNEDENFLQAMIFALEVHLGESCNNLESGATSKVDEFTERSEGARRNTRAELEKRIDVLWSGLRGIVSNYLIGTGERAKLYSIVKRKDDADRGVIARQLNHTATLFESIRKLKEKIVNFRAWADQRVAEITNEREYSYGSYWTVKNRFVSEQSADKYQLTIMTKRCNDATSHLKRLVTKGEHLLILIQACRKYETRDEKVLPFSDPIEPRDYPEGKFSVVPDWDRSRQVLEEFRHLGRFWRRAGAIQVASTELRRERDSLRVENRCLRQYLRRCISEGETAGEALLVGVCH